MHQTKKRKQCYLGWKPHIGVDAKQGTVHSVAMTAATMADCQMLSDLLHG
jgi:IS5 family transposase